MNRPEERICARVKKNVRSCQYIEHAQNWSCAPALQTTPANRATSTLISRTRDSFDTTSDLDPVPTIVEYVPPTRLCPPHVLHIRQNKCQCGRRERVLLR
ncbi:hypothetical protein K439DRAFT_1633641 [Ramaria rubella]|nr:hypothetical protein K439DRAFT_1643323 [Ramaria rubella]KAF8584359.1 hypothetical protein K439DRAFT_1633641 [Ramaria rubella]